MKRFCISFVFLVFMHHSALAAQYTVAHDATWPPFEFMDKNNNVAGYSVDYIRAVGQEAGFDVIDIHIPWDGIFVRLGQGEFQIIASSVTITPERQKVVDFSEPYFETTQLLLLPKDSKAAAISDLNDTILGAQTGTSGQLAINSHKGLTTKLYDDLEDAVAELASGKLSGVVCDEYVGRHFTQSSRYMDAIKAAPFSVSDAKEYYGFVVKKGDNALLERINAGIAAVKKKQIDKEIYTKWFGGGTPIH